MLPFSWFSFYFCMYESGFKDKIFSRFCSLTCVYLSLSIEIMYSSAVLGQAHWFRDKLLCIWLCLRGAYGVTRWDDESSEGVHERCVAWKHVQLEWCEVLE